MNHSTSRATLALPAGRAAAQRRSVTTPGLPARAWCVVQTWEDRSQWRRVLAQFDDRMLADIGFTRSQAEDEVRKAFWQA